jgi:hypothetical protein
MEKKEGRRGNEIKSNVTGNGSAMIHTSKGYIRGYIGTAVSGQKEQIIVCADAVGSANESGHFPRLSGEALGSVKEAGVKTPEGAKPVIPADNNHFSEENFKACEGHGIEAVIPDQQYRNRLAGKTKNRYEPEDFAYNDGGNYYECPAGKKLEYKGISGPERSRGKTYRAGATDCRKCPLKEKRTGRKKKPPKRVSGRQLLVTESNEQGSRFRAMRAREAQRTRTPRPIRLPHTNC